MPNAAKVAILSPGILNGSTPETAFALVLIEELTVEEKAAVNAIKIGDTRGDEPQYLYYQLFTQVGEDTSKVSFNANEPALGRIEKIHVSPPHGPATIKRCIAKAEGKPIYAYAELYQDISADTAMINGYYLSLSRDDGVGSTEDKPMVIVQPERREGLYNRPIKLISKTLSSGNLLPHAVGAIGHTDGIAKSLFVSGRRGHVAAYHCVMEVMTGGEQNGYLASGNPNLNHRSICPDPHSSRFNEQKT
ncbi:hypothetical protein B0H10DRAFT_907960 [Mycena sp. CBHHK59/15]|nr:hypothetical protein B0H10DRAFT_907960 [Mycena sp. CBHHK59/15]